MLRIAHNAHRHIVKSLSQFTLFCLFLMQFPMETMFMERHKNMVYVPYASVYTSSHTEAVFCNT